MFTDVADPRGPWTMNNVGPPNQWAPGHCPPCPPACYTPGFGGISDKHGSEGQKERYYSTFVTVIVLNK